MKPSCGAGSGVLPAMVSEMPCSTYRVPSVVMKEGSFRYWVTSPLNTPMSAAMARLMIRHSHSGRPSPSSPFRVTMMTGTSANVMPAERSISPQISRNVSPTAMSAAALKKFAMFWKFAVGEERRIGQPEVDDQGDVDHEHRQLAHPQHPLVADSARRARSGGAADLCSLASVSLMVMCSSLPHHGHAASPASLAQVDVLLLLRASSRNGSSS